MPHDSEVVVGTGTVEFTASDLPTYDSLASAKEFEHDKFAPLKGDSHSHHNAGEEETLVVRDAAARSSSLFKQLKGILGKNRRASPSQFPPQNKRCALNPRHYISVIVLRGKKNTYPSYNLDAKLGKRGGYTSIEFRCSAASDCHSSFRQIDLEVELFRLATQRRVLGKARTRIIPVEFSKDPQRSNQIGVEHGQDISAQGTVSGGGPGATAGGGLGVTFKKDFTRPEGVSFIGQNVTQSKMSWIWKADAVVKDGMQDPVYSWVKLPMGTEGVKAEFKVIGRVGRHKSLTLPEDKNIPAHELEFYFQAI